MFRNLFSDKIIKCVKLWIELAENKALPNKNLKKMDIVHISDTHFGSKEHVYPTPNLKKALADFINELENSVILIISGDITYKGSMPGFLDAQNFFSEVIEENKINRNKIIACPGNHDIIEDEHPPFTSFNKFIYALRRNDDFDFRKNNFVSYKVDDIFFLVVNSAHHLDHNFGFVDERIYEFLDNKKDEISGCTYKIAITHHHFLNYFKDNNSSIRNAYPFLFALDDAGFNLILHGHQHANLNMPIGNSRMLIKAARSFNFPEKGFPNGVCHYSLRDGKLEKNDIYEFGKDTTPTKLTLVKK